MDVVPALCEILGDPVLSGVDGRALTLNGGKSVSSNRLRVLLVVSTRPNFMKVAPMLSHMAKRPDRFEAVLVHTGQHYDEMMSDVFFADLKLPEPRYHLGIGSGTQGVQTGRTMAAFDPVLMEEKPDLVVVVGDVNSTLACAVGAIKLHIPVGHVEAGLRSRDRKMPEEINRIVTDVVSDFLFTPSRDADENLRAEGIPEARIHFVGNVMVDSLRKAEGSLERSDVLERLGLAPKSYALATAHRAANVDDPEALAKVIDGLDRVQRHLPTVFPVHPRTRNRLNEFGYAERLDGLKDLRALDPVGYLDSLRLQRDAALVVTDSAGLQEETTVLGVACLTMRPNTERPVTVEVGTSTIVNLDADLIEAKTIEVLEGRYKQGSIPELWDGRACERIVDVIAREL